MTVNKEIPKKKRIILYRQALKDWENTVDPKENNTQWGFCYYFRQILRLPIHNENIHLYFPEIANTQHLGVYIKNSTGSTPEGREIRITMLKRIIYNTDINQ